MSAERRHVAVDLGASGGRVALGTIVDGRLEVEVVHRFPNGGVPMQGGLYWDHVGLWREILVGLRLAGERGAIESVGVNSWGVDYALLDEYDHVIDGVRHYRDQRTEGVMDRVFTHLASVLGNAELEATFRPAETEREWFTDLPAEPGSSPTRPLSSSGWEGKLKKELEIHRITHSEAMAAMLRDAVKGVAGVPGLGPRDLIYQATGIQFMELNTLFQLYAQKEQTPAHLAQARSALMFPDLLHFWLSGQKVSEVTIASTTQMLDPYRRSWASSLMSSLGLPVGLFPEPVEPGTVLGPVLESLGVLKGAKVILPAAHDTGSAVAAVPASEAEGWAYISSGTWSLVGVESPQPVITAETAAQNLTNEAGLKGTTRLLKNVMGLWILQECRRAWGDPEFTTLYAEAEALPAGGPTIDPDDGRFLRPCDDMPALVRSFCRETGSRVPESRGEVTRCILDSLAKRSAEVLDGLERATGKKIHTVHIVGGGSQIEFLNRLIASASGRVVIAGPIEATLMGNLLIQAEAAGSIPPGSIRAAVRESVSLKRYDP